MLYVPLTAPILIFQQLKVLNGIDDDLTRAYTRLINQIRSSLVGTYPECEHLLRSSVIHRRWILELLAHYGGPTKLRRLGRSRAITCAKKHKARNPAPIVDALFDAITSQQLTLPGAGEAELGVALAATDALAKLDHRKRIHQQVLDIIDQIPPDPSAAVHARYRSSDSCATPDDHRCSVTLKQQLSWPRMQAYARQRTSREHQSIHTV